MFEVYPVLEDTNRVTTQEARSLTRTVCQPRVTDDGFHAQYSTSTYSGKEGNGERGSRVRPRAVTGSGSLLC